MSGHAGFSPIGNNIPRPIINNVPSVDSNVNAGGNVNNVPGGGEPQNPAEAPVRAADVAGQLDVLLLKAAKTVAVGTDAKGVEMAAKAAGLPKATVKQLLSLAEAAQKSLVKLDSFTGRQLAAAMVKNEDGTIGWKPKDAAAKALDAAQTAQIKLSSALATALGTASDATTQAALEEIMLQCDRRVAEIETLVLQMTEVVEKGGDKVQDEADKLAGGKISAFTSKDALDKFDRGRALAAMQAEIKPLADRLAGYAQGVARSITEADVASCTQELNAVKTKFSEAAASGKIEVGGKTIFCDRSMLAEAAKLLSGVEDKIASMHRDIIKGAMRNLVEKSFPFLKNEIFEDRFVKELSNVKTLDGETADKLAHFINLMNVLRNAARAYVESPTPENKVALDNAAEVLRNMNRSDAIECLDESFFSEAVPGSQASAEFKEALKKFKVEVAGAQGKKMLADLAVTVKRAYAGIDVAVTHLAELAKKLDAGPENRVYVSSWVLGAFRGEQTVSSIVEARAHGYSDSDIDARIDDANVADSYELGSGAFNTVTLLKLKDGSEWVFKPEMPGCLTTSYSSHYHGMAKNMEFTRVNLAVQDTANRLGLNDVMVKTKAGTHKGRFGMFMEKAPGLTGQKYLKANDAKVGAGKLSLTALRTLDEAKFGKVVGRLMRQANRLLWFDILTGQGDRHNDNYLVEIDKETLDVTLKAIDNDASYGLMRTGLNTFKFAAGSQAQKAFAQTLNTLAASSRAKNAFLKQVKEDPGIKIDKEGAVEIDMEKVANRQLVQGLFHFCGLRCTAVPEEMDSELHDKLVALAADAPDGGAARAEYLDSLATRLGAESEQYRCAVKRLDEAIAHARKLKNEGKVYTAEQWESHDVQKSVAKVALKKAKNHPDLPSASLQNSEAVRIRSEYVGNTNFFMRDFYAMVTSRGFHTNWFK